MKEDYQYFMKILGFILIFLVIPCGMAWVFHLQMKWVVESVGGVYDSVAAGWVFWFMYAGFALGMVSFMMHKKEY